MKKTAVLLALAALLVAGGLAEGMRPLSFASVPCGSGIGGVSADQIVMQTGGGVVQDCTAMRYRALMLSAGLLILGCASVVAGIKSVNRRPNDLPHA